MIFVFVGEIFYDKSSENQSDTVDYDNIFVSGGIVILPAPVTGHKTK